MYYEEKSSTKNEVGGATAVRRFLGNSYILDLSYNDHAHFILICMSSCQPQGRITSSKQSFQCWCSPPSSYGPPQSPGDRKSSVLQILTRNRWTGNVMWQWRFFGKPQWEILSRERVWGCHPRNQQGNPWKFDYCSCILDIECLCVCVSTWQKQPPAVLCNHQTLT